jgi:hypothetical protein
VALNWLFPYPLLICGRGSLLQGAFLLGEGLRNHPSVRTLVLSNMGLGDTGVGHIALALQENLSVQLLDLSRNHVGPAGAALCRTGLLMRNTHGHLARLELAHNPIGRHGAKRIMQAITAGLVDQVRSVQREVREVVEEREARELGRMDVAD